MKKWYRAIAGLLVFACFTGNLSIAEGKTGIDSVGYLEHSADDMVGLKSEQLLKSIESPEPTQLPGTNETPEPTQSPVVTEIPEPTQSPIPTETPEPIQTPEVTETPEPTKTPTEPTQTPSSSKKPNKLTMKLSQKKKKITLRFNTLEDASSYLVYIKESGKGYKKKTLKNKNSYTFSVEYGKTYSIKMAAKNKKKIFSKTKSQKVYIPTKVSSVHTISQGKKKVKLTWSAVSKADMYCIYRRGVKQAKFTFLGKRKKASYVDEELSYDKNYQYKIVPVTKRSGYNYKGKGGYKLFSNKQLVNKKRQKYRYTDMEEDIKALKKKYYGLISMQVIGKSEDGRKIYDVIIGNPDASKSMLVVAALHGREYMTSLLCMNQVEHYLQNYQEEIAGEKVGAVLKKLAIHFIPMANPDGVTISQDGIHGIKDSKLRARLLKLSDGNTAFWKANARGVDLNQNFPYKFKKHGKASSENYSGKKAASESETKAIIKLLNTLKKQNNLEGVVNYHATGSIVFGSCTRKGELKERTQEMYELARVITNYADSASYEQQYKGSGTGCLREYILYKKKIPSITLEIGWNPCPVPIKEFTTIWEKNKNLVLRQAMLFL